MDNGFADTLHSWPTDLAEKYLDALLRRDQSSAAAVIQDGLNRGLSGERIYLEILAFSQISLGELWHSGQINAALEHFGTHITLSQMEMLAQRTGPRNKNGFRVVVACVEGNFHYLGARMVSDLLRLDGWDVEFLGENTPTQDLVEYVRQTSPALVALSLCLEEHLPTGQNAISELRRLPECPKILLGGYAFRPGEASSALGADGVAVEGLGAIREARNLMGLGKESISLADHLVMLGRRVQQRRRERSWSQEQLARAADLDRTYISMVENGRQNLSLGAAWKLAEALDTPLAWLVSDKD